MQQASRRRFLQTLGASAALPRLASRLQASPSDEDYWQMVRRQFAFSEDKVPMNAANLCPSPRAVWEAVSRYTRDIDSDCSFQNRAKFRTLLEEARSKVAGLLKASPDEVALVRNTSEANSTIHNGLQLKPGDEVLVWDQNHPTNNVAWEVRAERFGLSVQRVATPSRPSGKDELISVFEKAFRPRTRVLAVTHVSNVTGQRLPMAELCQAAHRRGIYVHVDGAQTWGALDLDLHQMGCDSFAASAHKWFMGPKEAGLLFVRRENIARIWPGVISVGWGNDAQADPKGARKFESLGQRDDAALAALGVAADLHRMIGPDRIQSRIEQLAQALRDGLSDSGIEWVTPEEPSLRAGVQIMKVDAEKRRPLFNRLYQNHGIAAAPTGGLRLCPHIYNTLEHIQRAVAGIKSRMA